MKLFDYYRSTACYRVRIALNLKNIPYETYPVNLIPEKSEHKTPNYLSINRQGLVPTLDDNGQVLTQSIAIIEYLEDIYPTPALLPKNPIERACVRSLALMIACDMHPLNNLRVLQQLRFQWNATEPQVTEWYHHWLKEGFDAIEERLSHFDREPHVCYGDKISLADICLIPQVYNAHRFHFPMNAYPLINQINDYWLSHQAFMNAAPLERPENDKTDDGNQK